MPSLTDIPDALLHPHRLNEFVYWLSDTKTDFITRRELCHLWSKHTCTTIPNYAWSRLLKTALE